MSREGSESLIPELPGVMSARQVVATAESIVAMQQADGAIPWSPGAHTDVWNHLEAAMALSVAGRRTEAERAFDWCLRNQRHDGSWPLKFVAGDVVDPSGETNMSAYLAVALWHHWLIHSDAAFVRRVWPAVRRGLDFVVGMQLDFGGIAWTQEWDAQGPGTVVAEALLAGSSSIHQSLRAGVALAELVGEPQPEWELAGGRLGHAIRVHPERFLDKSTFSMDWYYPVLGGAVREDSAARLAERWADFVVDGLGVRCVSTNPWVTGAETCELVMALDALGDPRAATLFADMQHLRHENGSYWTGWVFGDDVNWPAEQTSYTAAAVLLATDALAATQGRNPTGGSGIMRAESLPEFAALGLQCGCASTDALSGSPRPAS